MAQWVNNLLAMWENMQSLGPEDPLEKEMAVHSSILAWRVPRTVVYSCLQSTESQRVGHNWVANILPPWVTLYTVLRVTALEQNRTHPEYFYFWASSKLYDKNKFGSVAQSCPTLCSPIDCSMPTPSPTPGACSNSCPLSQWCHPTISSSVAPFSSHLQSFPV